MNQNQRQSDSQSQQNYRQIIKYTVKKDTPKQVEQLLRLLFQYWSKIVMSLVVWGQNNEQCQLRVQSLSEQQTVQLFWYIETFEQTEFNIQYCIYRKIRSNLLRSINHIAFANLKCIRFNFHYPTYDYYSCYGFSIDNIQPLTYMKLDSLQELCFGYNNISSIKPLAHAYFPTLKHLGLQDELNHSQMCHLTRLTSANLQACVSEQVYGYDQEIDIIYFRDIFKLQSTKIYQQLNCHRRTGDTDQPRERINYEKMETILVKKYPNYFWQRNGIFTALIN